MKVPMLPDPLAWRLSLSLSGQSLDPEQLLREIAPAAQDPILGIAQMDPGHGQRSRSLVLVGSWAGYSRMSRAWSRGILDTLCSAPILQIEPLFVRQYCEAIRQRPTGKGPAAVRTNFVEVYGPRCQQAVQKVSAEFRQNPKVPPVDDTVLWVWERLLEKLDRGLLDQYEQRKGSQVGWLYTIMHHEAHDYVAKACGLAELPVAQIADTDAIAAQAAAPDGRDETGEHLDEDLRKDLRRLLELYRDAYPDQLDILEADILSDDPPTIEALADLLNKSVGAAYQVRSRTLANLRQLIEKHGRKEFPWLKVKLSRWKERRAREKEGRKEVRAKSAWAMKTEMSR